jgi:hypothetical protein
MGSIQRTTPPSGTAARVPGWVWFAGILLIIGGVFNLVHGFAALDRQQYFTNHIVYSNLTFWGWVFLIWGAVQLFAGFASIAGRMTGNYVGVLVASGAALLWFVMVFSTPWAAILGVTINLVIIYGLTAGAVDEWAD